MLIYIYFFFRVAKYDTRVKVIVLLYACEIYYQHKLSVFRWFISTWNALIKDLWFPIRDAPMPLLSPYIGIHFFVGRTTTSFAYATHLATCQTTSRIRSPSYLIFLLPVFSSYQLLNYLPHFARYNYSLNSKKPRRFSILCRSRLVYF